MKLADIDKLHQGGFITEAQRQAIVAHFHLDQESNRMLVILSIIGGLLVTSGVILLFASNWDAIGGGVKIAGGLALMLGAHFAGWWLRRSDRHPVVAEGLHLIGSGMLLGNIALIGQVYNLSSRPPNALLAWWLGIAALPWILRSRTQHILSLCAFGVWLGFEINERDSWIFFGGEARQMVVLAMCGLVFAGLGLCLRRGPVPEFGPTTEKFGLLLLHLGAFPAAISGFYSFGTVAPTAWRLVTVLTVAAVALLTVGLKRAEDFHDRRWRWFWGAGLLGMLGLGWAGLFVERDYSWWRGQEHFGPHWIALPLLFAFCLLQAQTGMVRRSAWLVNVAIVFLGLYVIVAYFELFGTMAFTGLVFVAGGVLLITLAVLLERQRRRLIRRMKAPITEALN